MTIRLRAAAFCGLAGLAACSHSSSEAVTDLAADLKTGSYVASIRINEVPADTPGGLEVNLATALEAGLARCATGTHPLRLEATVTRYKGENAAMTILVGSSNAIEGSARLVQPETGAVLGDYDIVTSTGGGGVIAAIAMADSQRDMARAFASDVCKKAFGHRPDFDAPLTPGMRTALAPVQYPQPNPPAPPAADGTAPWHEAPSQ